MARQLIARFLGVPAPKAEPAKAARPKRPQAAAP
jgi:hypothetical protein